jgi:hypothetical protein
MKDCNTCFYWYLPYGDQMCQRRGWGRKDAASLSTLQKVCDPFLQLLMSYLALKHMFCNSNWAQGNKDSHAHLDIIFYLHVCGIKIVSIVYISVGRFSLCRENHPVLVLSWCYQNLIGSLIYIYIYIILWAGETNQVIKKNQTHSVLR